MLLINFCVIGFYCLWPLLSLPSREMHDVALATEALLLIGWIRHVSVRVCVRHPNHRFVTPGKGQAENESCLWPIVPESSGQFQGGNIRSYYQGPALI